MVQQISNVRVYENSEGFYAHDRNGEQRIWGLSVGDGEKRPQTYINFASRCSYKGMFKMWSVGEIACNDIDYKLIAKFVYDNGANVDKIRELLGSYPSGFITFIWGSYEAVFFFQFKKTSATIRKIR